MTSQYLLALLTAASSLLRENPGLDGWALSGDRIREDIDQAIDALENGTPYDWDHLRYIFAPTGAWDDLYGFVNPADAERAESLANELYAAIPQPHKQKRRPGWIAAFLDLFR